MCCFSAFMFVKALYELAGGGQEPDPTRPTETEIEKMKLRKVLAEGKAKALEEQNENNT